jgi:pimeloyl-ACP methyl ester carboxylesterase
VKPFCRVFCCAVVLLASGCGSLQFAMNAAPPLKQAQIEGAKLNYVEQGRGETVVFVHGAFSDHRIWEGQRARIAKQHRYVALDQRYFGVSPWPDAGANYSVSTHADDLAIFIERLGAGAVHLVGFSYSGGVVLVLAARRPDLVKSLFLYEPALGSIITDPALRTTLAEERKGVGPSVAASKSNDQAMAVRLFVDWLDDQPGSFDEVPAEMRKVLLDNGHTLPLHFAAPPPPMITCAQLGQLKVPVTVGKGQQTRPFFSILSDAAYKCIPGARLLVLSNARHLAPLKNAAAINTAILTHLGGS